VCRELTKQFETVITMAASALAPWAAADANRLRGEFVLVVHAMAASASADESARHDAMLRTLLAELPLKQAVSLTAALSGAPRNALYARALELKDAESSP
jgi:16S rRNA (cytidine1402-2'-O)-methyltransferase